MEFVHLVYYAVSRILDGLRRKVAALGEREAEALLAAFGPMLVIVGRMLEEQADKTGEAKAARDDIEAELADAEAERDELAARIERRNELRDVAQTLLAPHRRERPEAAPPRRPTAAKKGPPKKPGRRGRSR